MGKENENNSDKLFDILQTNLNNDLLFKNTYSFLIKERRVKVIFSDNSKAPTIESALVKIASNRGK